MLQKELISEFIDWINTKTNCENILDLEADAFIEQRKVSTPEKIKLLAYELLEDTDTLIRMEEQSYVDFLFDAIQHHKTLTIAISNMRPIKDSQTAIDFTQTTLL
jgi:hypothetical protein